MLKTAQYWIEHLKLKPHPEGGFYREIYRSDEFINKEGLPARYSGHRNFSTSIYFLLRSEDISAFHRITSDEIWFFHAGSPVDIFILNNADLIKIRVGLNPDQDEVLQGIVPKNCWFGAKVSEPDSYTLVSCTVAPGFDFSDFELAEKSKLLMKFPAYENIITLLTLD